MEVACRLESLLIVTTVPLSAKMGRRLLVRSWGPRWLVAITLSKPSEVSSRPRTPEPSPVAALLMITSTWQKHSCHVCQRCHLVVGAPEVLYKLGDPLHAGEVEPDEGDLLAPSGPNDRLPRSLVIKRLSLTCMLVSFSNPLSEAENLSVEYIGSLVDACNDGAIFPHVFRS